MGVGPIRPTFEHAACMSRDELLEKLQNQFDNHACRCPYQVVGSHMVVTVPREQRRFWSPWLSLEVVDAQPGVVLHGRFSPKPAIWTAFMFLYITLITSGCFALMFGISKAIMNQSGLSWDIFGGILFLVALGLYVSSQVGQRLAHDQIELLHDLVRQGLGIEAHKPAHSEGNEAPSSG